MENPYILSIREKLFEFKERQINQNNVQFIWIPAYRGIRDNELVDKLAKEAAKNKSKYSIYPIY